MKEDLGLHLDSDSTRSLPQELMILHRCDDGVRKAKGETEGRGRCDSLEGVPEPVRDECFDGMNVGAERAELDLAHSDIRLGSWCEQHRLSGTGRRTCSALPLIMWGSLSIHSVGTFVSRSV